MVLAENGTQTIVLNRPVVAPNGTGSWAAGERAGFDPATARALIERGHARALSAAEERETAERRDQQDLEEYETRVAQKLTMPHALAAKFGQPADKMIGPGRAQTK